MKFFEFVILFTLPLMLAFTVNAGFPLKLYEAATIFLVLFHGARLASYKKYYNDLRRPLIVFFLVCLLSVLFGYFATENALVYFQATSWRDSPLFAGLAKLGYIMLVLFLFAYFISRPLSALSMARVWLWGAACSSLCFIR